MFVAVRKEVNWFMRDLKGYVLNLKRKHIRAENYSLDGLNKWKNNMGSDVLGIVFLSRGAKT